ncbi:hypothetical protein BpHYR1_008420 [Brachionus plicatilis]|uniref:Uncharacterized protein n=1 Tax=Brachionus plicatilis TaxID=10195 RepID=A0A3M7SBK8_BRAPC|nr:hypothetical protein BpHYR1_008420 [Brachionus plicatilis]
MELCKLISSLFSDGPAGNIGGQKNRLVNFFILCFVTRFSYHSQTLGLDIQISILNLCKNDDSDYFEAMIPSQLVMRNYSRKFEIMKLQIGSIMDFK